MQKVVVIGSGFAGISAATCLAQEGFEVIVLEKNSTPGGRARLWEVDGYRFDMGPSWYWMPEVFEHYFNRFEKSTSELYHLVRLDPSYRIFYSSTESMDLPATLDSMYALFEKVEPGSSVPLRKFLLEGKYKYEAGLHNLVYKPGLSISELLDPRLLASTFRLHVFQSVATYIRKYFKHPRLIQLLEFPILFLGADAAHTPALYTLMNYVDMELGTWYPQGGMYKIVEGMMKVAREAGVKFQFNSAVSKIVARGNSAESVIANQVRYPVDYVVASADYHHVEQQLLDEPFRQYSPNYWESRKLAPSCMIFYVGVNKKLDKLLHHNLFFDRDGETHIHQIYSEPAWPNEPLFYVCAPSKTDSTVAPAGHENLFILALVASGLKEEPGRQQVYFDQFIDRIESAMGETFRNNIVFKKGYSQRDFTEDYNAFKGNAYGLANTLRQTANLKPSIKSNKVKNLFYAGQLTVPGPGIPPALISGQVVAGEIVKQRRQP